LQIINITYAYVSIVVYDVVVVYNNQGQLYTGKMLYYTYIDGYTYVRLMYFVTVPDVYNVTCRVYNAVHYGDIQNIHNGHVYYYD
jgi:hypothetical protein